MRNFNAEIIDAAHALETAFGQHGPWEQKHVQAVVDLVRAKIEAERPKLMTVKEAAYVYGDARLASEAKTNDAQDNHLDGIGALLTEERKRTLAVIEGLPKHHTQVGQYGDAVLLRDIRSVLDRS